MTISQRAHVHDVLCDVVCTGRFYDFLEKRDGRWGIVLRQPIYEKDRIDPVDPAATLDARPGAARALPRRLPPSRLPADADRLRGQARHARPERAGGRGAVRPRRGVADRQRAGRELTMFAQLGGLETYYEEHGTGTPVVLVHGLGGNTHIWAQVAGPLSESFHVVRYDLRGLGRSGTPAPPYSMSLLVADLQALLERLALGRVALLGHSLGGAIALAYAAEHPEHVGARSSASRRPASPRSSRAPVCASGRAPRWTTA